MSQQPSSNQPTRRGFLKSAAVGSAALAANMALTRNVHAAGSDTIKVGIIGCGDRGSGAAENVLHAAPNVQIVAIGDAFKFRIDAFRKRMINRLQKDETVKKLDNTFDLPDERCFSGLDCHER